MKARKLRQLAISILGAVAVSGAAHAVCLFRGTLRIEKVPSGLSISFTTNPLASWAIERTESLGAGANTVWATLSTNRATSSGMCNYIDTNAPASECFYRARYAGPPPGCTVP